MSRISVQSKLASVAGGGTAKKPKKKKNQRAASHQVTELPTHITTSINTLICSVFSTLRASRPTSTCFEGNGIEFILSDEDIEEMLIFRIETLGSMLDNVYADSSSIIEFVMMEREDISKLIPSNEEGVVGLSRGSRITRTKPVT
ncbi:hypothetical protein BLNAU_21046 [Blattamonas nauphoetae]|uniref:Uncharacterized protein n=1 Tax=Blattamonas nauphoetae TaxID=2049346 RepID=A0ABQ9WX37_9EUKA|nr:hypothetical protein BLNAU_21046 [Blattamonas nauphoetae]